jgi:hypothetical protein
MLRSVPSESISFFNSVKFSTSNRPLILRTTSPFASLWILNICSLVQTSPPMQCNHAAIRKSLKIGKASAEECRELGQLTKLRSIITSTWTACSFTSRMRQADVPGGNERSRTCRCDSSLFMTATPFLLCVLGKDDVLLAMPFIVLPLSRRSFQLLLVKLFPMLNAFCSSEFFRETLDGARWVYLN